MRRRNCTFFACAVHYRRSRQLNTEEGKAASVSTVLTTLVFISSLLVLVSLLLLWLHYYFAIVTVLLLIVFTVVISLILAVIICVLIAATIQVSCSTIASGTRGQGFGVVTAVSALACSHTNQ